ncbi:MAG: BrnT family toxin [Candidatus Acidulodesulfobacterium sp.]
MDDDIICKLKECNGFDWDKGNELKNWLKHNVTKQECEEIFFNRPLIVASDQMHSVYEERFYCLGNTNMKKKIFLVFTLRNNKIRVISARNMSKKEKEAYQKNEKN